MAKRDRGASLADLLAEATGSTPKAPEPETAPSPEPAREGGGEAPPAEPGRASDGSYVRADGARRVSLQLKMDPDDKRALKSQAAAAGKSPAEYVAMLVRNDART